MVISEQGRFLNRFCRLWGAEKYPHALQLRQTMGGGGDYQGKMRPAIEFKKS